MIIDCYAEEAGGGMIHAVQGRKENTEKESVVRVSIYERSIPHFVRDELERLYESVYCTLSRLSIYGDLEDVSTYVEETAAGVSAVLLFRHERFVVKVLNQQVDLSVEVINRFSTILFSRYGDVRKITFYALRSKIVQLRFPFFQYPSLNENLLELPTMVEEYVAGLSSKFRANLRAAERNIQKKFPSFRYRMIQGAEITESELRDIISLTEQRMAFKEKPNYIQEEEIERLMRIIRAYGRVGIATIDQRICGGNIWYRVGSRCFMHLIAHDPQYNSMMLGNYLVYLGFCDAIQTGVRKCWLMGGGDENKARFGAARISLESLLVYRSRLCYWLDWQQLLHRAQLKKENIRKTVSIARSWLSIRYHVCALLIRRAIKRMRE